MPFGIQPWHIVVIILVALIVFGPSKLPELGRSIGKTINEFRAGAREMTESMKDEITRGDGQGFVTPPVTPTKFEAPPPPYVAPPVQTPQESSPVSPSRIFCTQCGTPNPADARFCKSCGNPLQV